MKILIVNTLDLEGGAARAANRLHKALLEQDVKSQMLVQQKTCDDFTIITEKKKYLQFFDKLRPYIDQLPVRFYKKKRPGTFSSSWFGFNNLAKKINNLSPDIVHLHWVNGGMLKIEQLAKIKAPIVWSLHDQWAFTGGCHYSKECDRYKDRCGQCNELGSNRANDLSRSIWRRKNKTFSKIDNMTVVGLSSWITNSAKDSSLLRGATCINLPNPIDVKIFKPFNKKMARQLWNLPQDKKLILFGAMSATSNPYKGFYQLQSALLELNLDDVELIIFGSSRPKNDSNFKFKTHYMGHVYDDISLVTLYSAANLVVVPSLQENLSNVIMESLACEVPVVAFNIGGNGDLIDHLQNGYLAKPLDTADLQNGIEWVLNNVSYDELCRNARKKVVKQFDSKLVANTYISLYKSLLTAQ